MKLLTKNHPLRNSNNNLSARHQQSNRPATTPMVILIVSYLILLIVIINSVKMTHSMMLSTYVAPGPATGKGDLLAESAQAVRAESEPRLLEQPKAPTTTRESAADRRQKIGTVFISGLLRPKTSELWGSTIFKEYHVNFGNFSLATPTSENDIYLSFGGNCKDTFGKDQIDQCQKWGKKFKGKTLMISGEPSGGRGAAQHKYFVHDRFYQIGYFPDTKHTMSVRFVQFALLQLGPKKWRKIFDPAKKAVSSRERFMIYASSHCLGYREDAAASLAEIGLVEYAGTCNGTKSSAWSNRDAAMISANATVGLVPAPAQICKSDWFDNSIWFGSYSFCLVMENRKSDGHITEKILNAFLAGCIPVYYGSTDVFDIFNKAAFVYYDIEQPEVAIERVRFLENNATAFEEVMDQPVLAEGRRTIDKYFSFADNIGDGSLKQRIHAMMGLPTVSETVLQQQ